MQRLVGKMATRIMGHNLNINQHRVALKTACKQSILIFPKAFCPISYVQKRTGLLPIPINLPTNVPALVIYFRLVIFICGAFKAFCIFTI